MTSSIGRRLRASSSSPSHFSSKVVRWYSSHCSSMSRSASTNGGSIQRIDGARIPCGTSCPFAGVAAFQAHDSADPAHHVVVSFGTHVERAHVLERPARAGWRP